MITADHGPAVSGAQARVEGLSELGGCPVQSSTKPVADGEKAGHEGADQVLASPGTHDGVVSAGHRRSVVGRDHQTHLQELAGVGRQPSLEPQQGEDAPDAHVLSEDLGDRDPGIEQLLATLVTDAGHEAGWLSDQPQLPGPVVVHGDWGWGDLSLGHDSSLLDEFVVNLSDLLAELVEGSWDDGSGSSQGGVLSCGRLLLSSSTGSSVTKLDVSGEHVRAGPDTPGNHRLTDHSVLDGLTHQVLLLATNLAQEDQHTHVRVGLVPQQVVHEGGAGISVPSYGHSLKHPVGCLTDDVVQLVAHPARPGDVRHTAGPVELAVEDVVHHPARVADLEAARLHTTHSGGAYDGHLLLCCDLEQLPGVVLGDSLGNDGDSSDLFELHTLQG